MKRINSDSYNGHNLNEVKDKKYELTDDTIRLQGTTLYRIRALIDIPAVGVRAGDLGGWVEDESNLSHEGNCWVGDEARVRGGAKIYDNALVSGSAIVRGSKTEVYGDSYVLDNSLVMRGAKVYGSAKIKNGAVVAESVEAYGNALISGEVIISGKMKISGFCDIKWE